MNVRQYNGVNRGVKWLLDNTIWWIAVKWMSDNTMR